MTYSAHDMAQASADGFRSGVASVAAQPQGVSERRLKCERLKVKKIVRA